MNYQEILAQLPYRDPFLFVDKLITISEHGVRGTYRFKEDAYFYKGHFKENPITPGVILTECCAQIGLACLGIFLIADSKKAETTKIALVQSSMEFQELVLPGEEVTVVCEKIYYRFGKLKCKVVMYNETNMQVCSGTLAGMIHKN